LLQDCGRAARGLLTTARERFWNWLGAVPHWLYFTELRRHPNIWSQVLIVTSLLGCFLAGVIALTWVLSGLLSMNPWGWLHQGLHRLDFAAVLRARPLWDLIMLLLMSGVTLLCVTGA